MKTLVSSEKPARKSPVKLARSKKPETSVTVVVDDEGTALRRSIEETLVALKTSEKFDLDFPPNTILADEYGTGLRISFSGIPGEIISDIPGNFTMAKRLAMARARVIEEGCEWTGIASANLAEAFEILDYDPVERRISVKIKEGTPTMTFPAADPKFRELSLGEWRPSWYGTYRSNSDRYYSEW